MHPHALKSPAISVPRESAERIISGLLREGRIDKSLRIRTEGDFILIPVHPWDSSAVYVEADFIPRVMTTDPMIRIRQRVKELGFSGDIPEKWVRYGDSIMFNVPVQMSTDVASIYAETLGVKKVYVNRGRITGDTRTPSVELVYGEHGTVTHLENGIRYVFDPEHVMFSPGNVHVRGEIETDVTGRLVIDFFSGIGYFSLPIAKFGHPGKVVCIDINPVALEYLGRAAKVNKVESVVETLCADSSVVRLKEIGDVGILGNFQSLEMLDNILSNLRDNATVVIHHLVSTEKMGFSGEIAKEKIRLSGRDCTIISSTRIKSYAPHMWHMRTIAKLME